MGNRQSIPCYKIYLSQPYSFAVTHYYEAAVFLQVFRLEDYACLYTLHGHTGSITALYLDKVNDLFSFNPW